LIDIGVNLAHDSFDADRDAILERAAQAGVAQMVVTGSSEESTRRAIELSATHRHKLFATAGVHPHNARGFEPHTPAELRELARAPEVVAIGECGLDYDRDFSPRDRQRVAFESQLELAGELGKPVFLHERAAHADFLAILKNARSRLTGGVVHCFTGSERELAAYLELDLCIGITGFICDERRGAHLQALVGRIPSQSLLVETDAPFLLPRDLRLRTRRNEPCYLPHVAQSVARFAGRDETDVRRDTTAAAFRLFGLEARFGQR